MDEEETNEEGKKVKVVETEHIPVLGDAVHTKAFEQFRVIYCMFKIVKNLMLHVTFMTIHHILNICFIFTAKLSTKNVFVKIF